MPSIKLRLLIEGVVFAELPGVSYARLMSDSDQEDQTIQTYDKYAESWAVDHPLDDYGSIIAKLKELAPRGSVLEIGCGSGQDAEMLTQAGYDYLGTDAAQGMVNLASSKHPGITFQHRNCIISGA